MKLFYSRIMLLFCMYVIGVPFSAVSEERMPPECVSFQIKQSEAKGLYTFDLIPDSTEVRIKMLSTHLTAPIETITTEKQTVYTDSNGKTFKISATHENDYCAISVEPVLNRPRVSHTVVPGTWVLYRNRKNGKPMLIKIYPRETPSLCIYLRPAQNIAHKGKSFIDIGLYNAYVCRGMPLGVDFKDLYTLPLSDLHELTQAVLPWQLFLPPLSDGSMESMLKILRNRTYRLVYMDNACFNEHGDPVYIDSLLPQSNEKIAAALYYDQQRSEVLGGVSDAGFVKWIIDGLIKPISGSGSAINSLKRSSDVPITNFTRDIPSQSNSFFRLNWIRNLASAALSLNVRRTVYPQESGIDVTLSPFARTSAASPLLPDQSYTFPFSGYKKNAGYQIAYINALMYYFAAMEPGHFYLGCVNRLKKNSSTRQYSDITAFFPYFDKDGMFRMDIFEKGERINPADFIRNNLDASVALVRIRTPETGLFNP